MTTETNPGDVIVSSCPKSGTTWLKQTLKLIMNNGVENGIDVGEHFPSLEMLTPEEIKALPSPKYVKTHLPYCFTPGGDPVKNTHVKYIYIYHNPKDSAVSMFHHAKSLHFRDISWDAHFEEYCIRGQVPFGYVVDHILGWWRHKDEERSHTVVNTLADFLGYHLTKDACGFANVEQTTFSSMKLNPAANNSWMEKYHKEGATPFMRKGIIGDWKNYFSDEQSTRLDALVNKKVAGQI